MPLVRPSEDHGPAERFEPESCQLHHVQPDWQLRQRPSIRRHRQPPRRIKVGDFSWNNANTHTLGNYMGFSIDVVNGTCYSGTKCALTTGDAPWSTIRATSRAFFP